MQNGPPAHIVYFVKVHLKIQSTGLQVMCRERIAQGFWTNNAQSLKLQVAIDKTRTRSQMIIDNNV